MRWREGSPGGDRRAWPGWVLGDGKTLLSRAKAKGGDRGPRFRAGFTFSGLRQLDGESRGAESSFLGAENYARLFQVLPLSGAPGRVFREERGLA